MVASQHQKKSMGATQQKLTATSRTYGFREMLKPVGASAAGPLTLKRLTAAAETQVIASEVNAKQSVGEAGRLVI
jgi:hypothetical protein